MHVLQYITVQAGSSKEAFKNVKSKLEEVANSNFWSDWHVVGGGRWSKNSKDYFVDTPQDVISYVKDKSKFLHYIEWTKKARIDEMKNLLSNLQRDGGEAQFVISALEYIKKAECNSVDLNAYYVNRITEMLMGHWTSDSYFFDIESNTGSYKDLEQRIQDDPDNVYLVPVDFHF
jgi:hypothetical protein